jgi:hypothetical protein
MKNIYVILAVFMMTAPLMKECGQKIPVEQAYPHHFAEMPVAQGRVPTNYLPKDILNSLPPDFRLANNLGYLTTFIYKEGEVVLPKPGAPAKRKLTPGKAVKWKYEELRSQAYKVFVPPQFPHVLCAYPDIDLVENFETEASIDLIKGLILIEEKETELAKLESELKSLTEGVASLEQQLLSLDTAVVDREKETAEIQTRISEFEGKFCELRKIFKNRKT